MAGSREHAETVSAFFQDMRRRGLGDPLLAVSDGAAGIVKAVETRFPRSARQRCLAHRMRNLAAKVPVFGAMIRAAERWRAIGVGELERRQMRAAREELDQEYEAANGLGEQASAPARQAKIPSTSRT